MKQLRKSIAVVAFRCDGEKSHTHKYNKNYGWRPAIFSNMPSSNEFIDPDDDLFVWEAAMRTSAAPTYFPIYQGYADGAVVANNPSIIAYCKALAHNPNLSKENINVLSLGSGFYPRHVKLVQSAIAERQILSEFGEYSPLSYADWGISQWMPFLLDLLLDGDSSTTDMSMHYLLGNLGKYHRLDPQLPKNISIDDYNSMKLLIDLGNQVALANTIAFIDKL